MPGFGVGDHQVARHPVAVHGDARLRQRAGDEQVAGVRPTSRCSSALQVDAALASDAPVGEERELAPQQRVVVRRQRRAGDLRCQTTSAAIASRISASARRSVAARLRGLQRVEVELAAEVVEQQEAVLGVRLEHARRVQAGGADQAGDVDERPHVLLRRRRVHHDDAAAVVARRRASSGGSSRRSRPARRLAATTRVARRRPRRARRRTPRRGPGRSRRSGGRRGGRGHGRMRGRVEERAGERLMDNRFYKSMPDRRRRGCPVRRRARESRPRASRASASRPVRPAARQITSAIEPRRGSGILARGARRLRRRRVGAAAALAAAASAGMTTLAGIELRRADRCSRRRAATPRKQLPIILRARELRGRPDLDAEAEGDVEFRRGGMVIRADRLTYDQADDLARATGNVVVTRDGNVFSGPELQLQGRALRRLLPQPDLPLRPHRRRRQGEPDRLHRRPARRRDRRDLHELHLEDGDGEPVWILKAREHAHRQRDQRRHRPRRACCASTACRSWPRRCSASRSPTSASRAGCRRASASTAGAASRSAIPYYWNIAPNRDATFTLHREHARAARRSTPSSATSSRVLRRGRRSSCCRTTAVADRSRHALRARSRRRVGRSARYVQLQVLRVSDDDYWKDFPRESTSLTPRLLQTDLRS